MKKLVLLLLCLAGVAYSQQLEYNRYATTPEGVLINGSSLTNVNAQSAITATNLTGAALTQVTNIAISAGTGTTLTQVTNVVNALSVLSLGGSGAGNRFSSPTLGGGIVASNPSSVSVTFYDTPNDIPALKWSQDDQFYLQSSTGDRKIDIDNGFTTGGWTNKGPLVVSNSTATQVQFYDVPNDMKAFDWEQDDHYILSSHNGSVIDMDKGTNLFTSSDGSVGIGGGNVTASGTISSNLFPVALVKDLAGIVGIPNAWSAYPGTNSVMLTNAPLTSTLPMLDFEVPARADTSVPYYLMKIRPMGGYTNSGSFNINEESAFFNGVDDNIITMGWNQANGAQRQLTNAPAMWLQWEQLFQQTGIQNQSEFHLDYIDRSGNNYRPMFFGLDATNPMSDSLSFSMPLINFYYPTNNAISWLQWNYLNLVYQGNCFLGNIIGYTNDNFTIQNDSSVGSENGFFFWKDFNSAAATRNWTWGNGARANAAGHLSALVSNAKGGDPASAQSTVVLDLASNETVALGNFTATGKGSFGNIISATNGISSYASNLVVSTSIAVGASPFNWTNTIGKNVFVYIDGAGVSSATAKNGQTIYSALTGADVTVPLQPNQWVTVTYTIGAPAMRYDPQ